MADTEPKQQGAAPQGATPQGAPPQSDEHTNAPGMTNGVPDQLKDADATAVPGGSREEAETAPGKPGG